MADTKTQDQAVNALILEGKALEAFDRYYADDVSMQENANPPTVGKAVNREREIQFFGSIEKVHRFELGATSVQGDTSFSEWFSDVEIKGVGRVQMTQVARRLWKDGKIVDERFYYNTAA